jgi:hypothetical protein
MFMGLRGFFEVSSASGATTPAHNSIVPAVRMQEPAAGGAKPRPGRMVTASYASLTPTFWGRWIS